MGLPTTASALTIVPIRPVSTGVAAAPRDWTAIGALALLAAVAPLLAGCSGPGRSEPGAPAADSSQARLEVTGPGSSQIPGSFAQAILTESGRDVTAGNELQNAVQLLTQRCMQAEHLTYYPDLSPLAAQQNSIFYPLYGTLAERQANGYGIYVHAVAVTRTGQSLTSAPPTREDSYRSHLPLAQRASYDLAIFGPQSQYVAVTEPGGLVVDTPGGGCAGQAGRELFGSVAAESQVITGATLLSGMFKNAVVKEPSYSSSMRRWADCMSGQGYHYEAPFAAYASIYNKVHASGPTPALKQLEIATAMADFQCAGTVALVSGITQAENQVMSHLGHAFEGYLLRDVAATQAAVGKARSLVGFQTGHG
jgi:hypothetical protein